MDLRPRPDPAGCPFCGQLPAIILLRPDSGSHTAETRGWQSRRAERRWLLRKRTDLLFEPGLPVLSSHGAFLQGLSKALTGKVLLFKAGCLGSLTAIERKGRLAPVE